MELLRKSGITLSPYVEFGAERCQRSLVMENDLDASGVATDISFHSLRSCNYYQKIFKKNKTPLRICCDSNSLPFMTNSVPFIFCYETLHHFPDPAPVIKEVHRVLSPGGYFFFDEEPLKKMLHINLYKRLKKGNLKKTLILSRIRWFMDFFFAKQSCNEIEHGVIENNDLSLSDWRNAVRFFKHKKVILQSVFRIELFRTELINPKNYLNYFLAYLLGANVTGLCRKSGVIVRRNVSISDVLMCPSCIKDKVESKLVNQNSSFYCNHCGKKFPIVDGVAFLFSYEKLSELYPDIFGNLQLGS